MNKKLLFISAFDPFDIRSGGSVRSFQILKNISKKFDTHLIYFGKNDPKNDLSFKSTKKIDLQKNSVLTGIRNKIPYWFTPWFNQKLIDEAKFVLKDQSFDLILIEGTQLLYINPYLPKSKATFFSAYDIQTVSFFRRLGSCNLKNFLVHILRFIEVFLYEFIWLKKIEALICASDIDREVFKKYFGVKNSYVFPNGMDNEINSKKIKKNILRLGFIGSINHPPNKQAINILIHKIVPKINEKLAFTLTVVSKDADKFINFSTLASNIKIYDEVENLSSFFDNIDVLVVPIYSGSGSRIKILDAISYKVPVVSTKIGAEGIPSELLNYVKIKDDLNGFINAIKNIDRAGNYNGADQKIIDKYSWKQLTESFYKQISPLLDN